MKYVYCYGMIISQLCLLYRFINIRFDEKFNGTTIISMQYTNIVCTIAKCITLKLTSSL